AVAGNLPKCVLVVTVEAAFFQCSRAILRSKLWQHGSWASVPGVPSAGSILASLTSGEIDGKKYDLELPGRQQTTLY
ncbi:MAG: pyridoxamine 5'-phosphate oxidase family protein, partial [Verrucomicrobium sp.]